MPSPSSEIGRATPGPFTVAVDVPLATAGEADREHDTTPTVTVTDEDGAQLHAPSTPPARSGSGAQLAGDEFDRVLPGLLVGGLVVEDGAVGVERVARRPGTA